MTFSVIDFGLAFLASVTAGLFVWWVTQKLPYLWIVAASSASFFIVALLVILRQPWYWITLSAAFIVVVTWLVRLNRILADAGVSRVWTRKESSAVKYYKDTKSCYKWLGFSAEKETEKSVGSLRDRQYNIKLSLLKHSLFPTFRVTLVDDQKIFVGAYEPIPGKKLSSEYSGGFFSDFIELRKSGGKNLLFKWFSLYYERERLHAEKYSLERFAVSERCRAPYISIESLTQKAAEKGLTYMDKPVTQDVLKSIMGEFGIPEEGPTICPIKKNASGDCPLGIEQIVPAAKNTIESIFDTKREYHFVGIGSDNIFHRMEDSGQLDEFIKIVDNQKENPIKFHIVVRDNENVDLMHQQDEWRWSGVKHGNSVENQVTSAIKRHNLYRGYGWFMKTYKSDTLANFRVVVVDDVVYVSFNEPGKSSQSVHQLIIRKKNTPYNLYHWFRKYVELAQKDVERKNKHRLMAPSVIEPTCHDPDASEKNCPFCRISNGMSNETYDKVLFRSKNNNYLVIPAKGHFCPGYLLVIYRKHIYSFASIITESALRNELFELIENIRLKLREKFKEPIIFEHGSKYGGGYSGNTIDHAHLHFVPCDLDLTKALIDDHRGTKRINDLVELQSMNRPYLFVQDRDKKNYVAEVEHKMESQYLRRLLYGLMHPGVDDYGWDWRRQTHDKLLQITLEKLTHGDK